MGVLLSACMIVKDEAENLPACLASMTGLVDEVIVYDTGSTDATVDVARDAAARASLDVVVVDGYWDDDFGRARNAAMEHCRGAWILWIDADEIVDVDAAAGLRSLLAAVSEIPDDSELAVDALQITMTDEPGVATASTQAWRTIRLLRRERCWWSGALHEQVRTRGDLAFPRTAFTENLRLRHRGYRETVMVERDKYERNIRIARSALERARCTDGEARALVNLARSLLTADRFEEAADAFAQALAAGSITAVEEMLIFEGQVRASIHLGRWRDVETGLVGLWKVSEQPTLPMYLRSLADLRRGSLDAQNDAAASRTRLARAADTALSIPADAVDDTGTIWGPDTTAPIAADAHAARGDERAAATVALATFSAGFVGVHLGKLVTWMDASGLDLALLAQSVPPWLVKAVAAHATKLDPETALRILESLFGQWPDDGTVAAVASLVVGPELAMDRREVWDGRLARIQAM